jgi:diguanylate cyclase (GGDEF)-like protein/PAS domain S-box-containing protein
MDANVSSKWSIQVRASVLLALIALGLIGNYFKYPIFLNIDFLFGSIFAMLALQVFGLGSGIVVGAITAAVTYFLWNHPYAIIIMTAEVAAVGLLMRHKNIGLVLADAIYWLVIGMPLVYVFYHGIMDVPLGNTSIVMTKQAVNGVANALLARLLFSGYALATGSANISYRDLIYNLLSFFALYPALILLMVSSHIDFLETDRQIRYDLVQNTRLVSNRIDVWSRNRAKEIGYLAALAATLNPEQMQPRLVQTHESDANYLRIGLHNKEAVTTAFSPPFDEFGNSNIGRNFADRPFIPRLKQTLKPMLSEVVMGQIGKPKPIVSILAPVVKANEYQGYVSGILILDELKEFLDKNTQSGTMLYALLDTNGRVILTNHIDLKFMQTFGRSAGRLNRLDESISQWIPKVSANTPISEQWKSSFYVADSPVGVLPEWRLILEQPVAPFQKVLYAQYTDELALLFVLLFTALALAEFLSRQVVARTEQLSQFTKTLPKELSLGVEPVWPKSNLTEHHNLIERFKEMATSLSGQFSANQELTATLEKRVAERTAALMASEEKFRLLIDNSHDIIYTLNQNGLITYVSPAWTGLLGHQVDAITGHPFSEFVHPDDLSICTAALIRLFATGQLQTDIEYRVRHLDQSWHWHSSNALPMKDEAGKVTGFEGTAKDITLQKGLEDAVRQMAFYDSLTKLPNRRLLTDRLSQVMAASKRSSSYAALMFLDLDNFKPLNDTHGHSVGDLLLVEVGNRLTESVRQMDTVARFGGDEFVVLLGDLGTVEPATQAQMVAEKIRASLAEPYLLVVQQTGSVEKVVEHHCTVSIGVVVFVNHNLSQTDVLKWADDAMYQAKDAGRNSIRFHEMSLTGAAAVNSCDPAINESPGRKSHKDTDL